MNKKMVLAMLILELLVLHGCGSGDDSSSTPTPTLSPTPRPAPMSISTPTPTLLPISTPTPDLSSKIKKTGKNIVSYNVFDDGYYDLGVTPSYSREGNVVVDNITGLRWLEIPEQSVDWEDAMYYCNSIAYDGDYDWRLPTIKELLGLIDRGNEIQAFDPIFSELSSSVFWSSTIVKEQDSLRWGIHILNVGGYRYEKSYKHAIMCVRG